VALLTRHLKRAGYNLTSERVDTPEAMRAALSAREWDVILCDYSMPHFSALSALALLKETGLDIPFIIISGTIGEEVAVEAMRAGAHDYLMKDNLARLAPAIERELEETKNRRERRGAKAELRGSEAQYRRLIDTAYEGIWVADAKAHITYANQRLADMLGYTVEEMIGRSAFEVLDEATSEEVKASWQRRLQGIKEQYDLRLRRKDGSNVWVILSATPIRDEQGEVTGALAMLTDITERKRVEEELRESQERYKGLVDTAFDGVVIQQDRIIKGANRSYAEMFGYSIEELIGRDVLELIPPEQRDYVRSKIAEDELVYETLGLKKDGTHINIEVSAKNCLYEGEPARLAAVRDITERKKLEEQLRQSQKMEAVGQLAGGIAHDFNNLLTAITGYSDLAMRKLQAEDPLRRNLEEIKKAGDRAAALTRQLLAFSRKQVLQPVVLNINAVLSELEKMLRRLIGEDVDLRTALEPELGSIKADPGQIEQVLMNLVVNARDAMPSGGKLTIETENVYLDEAYARQHTSVTPGHYVMLAVSDTGIGMDENTRVRIFEPFFTTKETGKGTGLGLSTVYGIVKQSGGNVWVYSEVGRGTTFKVYLPRVDEGAQEYKRTPEIEEILQGTETILLAEDEELVRALAREILETYGYRVLEASNGGAALLICEREKEPIDLLITDVIMPEMGGRQLVERLNQLRPEMKVLYMSGYTDNAIVHQGVLDEGANFIQKPFAPDALARKVREVLNASTEATK